MAVEIYELRLRDAPGEIWYGAKVNGRDLNAGWADPEAARRRGEEYARELRAPRGRSKMETETPTEEPTLPEPEETPEAEPETEEATEATPEENGDDGEE